MSLQAVAHTIWENNCYRKIFYVPLALCRFVYYLIIQLRYLLYKYNFLKSYTSKKLIICVGNIVVGGVGKTPVVLRLAEILLQHNLRPIIISRGFTAKYNAKPYQVMPFDSPENVGDEPLLMAQRKICPVIICKSRVQAVQFIEDNFAVDIIISDDGLQHYQLNYDIKILLQNPLQNAKNNYLLPQGPRRGLLQQVLPIDFALNKVVQTHNLEHNFTLNPCSLINLKTQQEHSVDFLQAKTVVVICAIANPQSFIASLERLNIKINTIKIFSDHYQFRKENFTNLQDLPIVMTEKDAVKCYNFASDNMFFLKVRAQLDTAIERAFVSLVESKC